jgi:hypothetical protein
LFLGRPVSLFAFPSGNAIAGSIFSWSMSILAWMLSPFPSFLLGRFSFSLVGFYIFVDFHKMASFFSCTVFVLAWFVSTISFMVLRISLFCILVVWLCNYTI